MSAPGVRVFDCTTYLRPRTDGQPGYISESGRANYDKGHIPGAAFLDLAGELSDTSSKLRYTLPPLGELTKAFAAKGIGHGTFVVLYSHATPTWATRIWWMLRAIGFDDAAILDGGLDKWKAENRPLSTEATTYPPATLTLRGRPEIFVDKNDMKGAIGKKDTLTLNALSHDQHKGSGGVAYGRPGRIAGSSCVPAASLFGPDKTLKPVAELRAAFEGVGAKQDKDQRILVYCGGGIAASLDAFVLTALLGHRNVAVYDNSMQEWSNDPSLPMEVG
jgi:thiosulfate/3-mercaptopyruvate sulfurtransferase